MQLYSIKVRIEEKKQALREVYGTGRLFITLFDMEKKHILTLWSTILHNAIQKTFSLIAEVAKMHHNKL